MSGISGRALGLDLGSERIGVAISDGARAVATPLTVVPARDRAAADRAIAEIVDEWEPTIIVVGLPLRLDGQVGISARRAAKVTQRLRDTLSPPIVTYDERLTTVTAHRILDEQNVAGRQRKEMIDMVAAQVILQGWMDKERI